VTSNTIFTEKQTHTFTKAGVYTVELFATNGCSSNSTTKTITVYEQPLAAFKADQTIGCSGLNVKFSNSSKNAVSYVWDFGDGTTSTQVAPTHVYTAKQGQFTVKLTAFNSLGCPQTTVLTDYIKIIGPPVADFSISPAAVISIPENTFKFTNESTNNPQTYQWSFGDGVSSNLKDPTHMYADTGKYLVKLKVFNEQGCVDSTQKYVQIMGVPGYLYVPNSFIPGGTSLALQIEVHNSNERHLKLQYFLLL
jgi:PKD repeat protein